MLLTTFFIGLLCLAVIGFVRYHQATQLRQSLQLSAEERLRVALALQNLEDAMKEVAKVAHGDSIRVYQLQLELEEIRWRTLQLLRTSTHV